MKILVIEDKNIHQVAAKEQLVGHEVSVIGSFEEYFALTCHIKNGGRVKPIMNVWEYDMVLTDVNLPSLNGDRGTIDASTGFIVALHALKHGVSMVGVYTDASHHEDPCSKGLDLFMNEEITKIGNQTMGMINGYTALNVDGVYVKNWKMLAAALVAGEMEE